MKANTKKEYSVTSKKIEAPGIVTLRLVPVGTDRPEFISGQFLTVYFPDLGLSEGKAYSISSAPHEEGFSITVKGIGTYSKRLCGMESGDTLVASGPYGFFYSEEEDSTLVLLAAGIGVVPFKGMVEDIFQKNPSRKVALHYSTSKVSQAAFLEIFSSLQEKNPNFVHVVHVTKEPATGPSREEGRISADRIVQLYSSEPSVEYLMCGPIPFVRDMWRTLRAQGVSEDRLYTEAFFG